MKVPFLDLKPLHQSIKKEVFERLNELYDQTEFAYGKAGKQFEQNFAQYNQMQFACAIDNGTTGVELCLRAAGIGTGHEVITVSNTFIATVAGIHFTGAKPVFCEIDPFTWNMDPGRLEEKITSRTRAILPVHLYGQPADLLKIRDIAQRHNLVLIGDSAQSIGSKIHENGEWKPTSCFADLSSFSFYAGKNLGACGEAGAIVTNNEKFANFINAFRDHGSSEKYIHEFPGRNNRIDAFQAAILDIKLKHIDLWNEKRRQIAAWYLEELKDVDGLQLPQVSKNVLPVWHLFVVLVKNREKFQKFLADKEVGTALHYKIPVHLQNAFRHLGHGKGYLPITEEVESKNVSLPMFPELSREQVSYTCEAIRSFFNA